MSEVRKVSMWTRLRSFYWGEASLWLLFLFAGIGGTSDGGNGTFVTFSGIAALSAIGVRATRVDRSEARDAEG